MTQTPLPPAYAAATLSTLLALLVTEPALGHVDVRPGLVEQGAVAQLLVELPQLRAGPPPIRLEVEGNGLAVLASDLQRVAGAETVWSVRIRVTSRPGQMSVILRAFFADGESVEVDSGITVVPPAESSSGGFPWRGVVAGVTLGLCVAVAGLLATRRRR